MFIRGSTRCLLVVCALLAGCVAPTIEDERAAPKPEAQRLFDELRANPRKLELYPRYLDLQFAARDLDGILDTLEYCTANNGTDPRAWLIKAGTLRQLLRLAGAQAALDEALRLAPASLEVLDARASFFRETWQFSRERAERERILEVIERGAIRPGATAGKAVLDARLTLTEIALEERDLPRAKALLQTISPASTEPGALTPTPLAEAWMLEVRIALIERDGERINRLLQELPASIADAASQHSGVASESVETPEAAELVYAMLARLVSLHTLANGATRATAHLSRILERGIQTNEAPAIRFACFFGQWQLAWHTEAAREAGGEAAGTPPEHDELTRRIEQLAPAHPGWLRRALQVAQISGDSGALERIGMRLAESGLGAPEPLPDLAAVLAAWRMEDAMRLGLPALAAKEATALLARMPESSAGSPLAGAASRADLLLARASALLAARDYPAVIAMTDAPVLAHQSRSLRAAFLPLRWKALVGAGEAQRCLDEMAAAASQSDPPPVAPHTAAWLKAVAELHTQ